MKRIVLAALAVFCLSPAVANATSGKYVWQSEGVTIPEGEKVPIVAWGNLTLTGTSGVTGELICRMSGAGIVENLEGSGSMTFNTPSTNRPSHLLVSSCATFTICPSGTAYAEAGASAVPIPDTTRFQAQFIGSAGKLVGWTEGLEINCYTAERKLTRLLQYKGENLELPVDLGTSALHPAFVEIKAKLKSTYEFKSEVETSGALKFLGAEAQELINKHDPPGTPARHARRHRHHHHHKY